MSSENPFLLQQYDDMLTCSNVCCESLVFNIRITTGCRILTPMVQQTLVSRLHPTCSPPFSWFQWWHHERGPTLFYSSLVGQWSVGNHQLTFDLVFSLPSSLSVFWAGTPNGTEMSSQIKGSGAVADTAVAKGTGVTRYNAYNENNKANNTRVLHRVTHTTLALDVRPKH